jgi:uncharacterized protein YbcC (UPF0753/DUF2309 family)
MSKLHRKFDTTESIEELRHYLPSQAALKDFVHHNTLHAFQNYPFHDANWRASTIFGYRTYLSLDEFRALYESGQIKPNVLQRVIQEQILENPKHDESPFEEEDVWMDLLLHKDYDIDISSRLFQLSNKWKSHYKINLSKIVHPLLFRLLAGYLDQGIADWKFPVFEDSFLDSLRALERNGHVSLFKTKRARSFLLEDKSDIKDLLRILVGDERYYEQYIFDQQFKHPGWSGFVSVVESNPETLLDHRKISLKELIYFECLMEIDALDKKFGTIWKPLMIRFEGKFIQPLLGSVPKNRLKTILKLWQEAYEWSYFDGVLAGIQESIKIPKKTVQPHFQGLFCIDDRAYSFRRHIETIEPNTETYGTPGYFGVAFYFQPENGKFVTKACPANIDPDHLIKEFDRKKKVKNDHHFNQKSHSLLWGGIISGALGYWSGIKLFSNLFKPALNALSVHSFDHSDKHAFLQVDAVNEEEFGLNIGFLHTEMAELVFDELKRIGLTKKFAPLVYLVGHGGSSVNNPYYAGYDCGACCGRPGAVNARVFAYMANNEKVRELIKQKGIDIPVTTYFIGAMHDTTRDEIEFYQELKIPEELQKEHRRNAIVFKLALEQNAKERSYRFETINNNEPLKKIHRKVKNRAVSLFEPRPEWNHTDNALCIVGRKNIYDHIYLDKRPFLNSYDYAQDPDGKYLETILSAAIPVCGGINLEYYYSRVDQEKLGAGTKLPHNIVGLFALNTGVDGDLRTGLPSQMIEIHDPLRILFIIEHSPQVIFNIIKSNPALAEWIENEWVLLVALDPESNGLFRFSNGEFKPYTVLQEEVKRMDNQANLMDVISKKESTIILNKK